MRAASTAGGVTGRNAVARRSPVFNVRRRVIALREVCVKVPDIRGGDEGLTTCDISVTGLCLSV
jgi:hypothetical protein